MLCALMFSGLAGAAAMAQAAPAEPKNGVDYLTLPQAQNTDAGKQVEVTEFFAYYCPHCNVFEPQLAAWVKKQGANIVFKRVHVPRDAMVAPQQRLYYTLEAMGLLEQYHGKVFAAMHQQRQRLGSDEAVFDWAQQAGIERARFIDAYGSFGVSARVRRANAMMEGYRIDSWPMIAVDGRFLTSPAQAGEGAAHAHSEAEQQQAALQVMDYLVARAKAEKK
jgi:thiol:disulfide interchange protein DsbA